MTETSYDFIIDTINETFDEQESLELYSKSTLIRYLTEKTKSVYRSSKARSSFANLYALYVLIEDYFNNNFQETGNYSSYEGMMFSKALERVRELPFGEKLQNHALNSRCNDEFRKFFNAETSEVPIYRDLSTRRYKINESLLLIELDNRTINIAPIILKIIDKYIELKSQNFNLFFEELEKLKDTYQENPQNAKKFFENLLQPNVDARLFELVSFSILKYHYIQHQIIFGESQESLSTYNLSLYKTGRTNANDGGIDFIMVPTGRIFQVTEVLYFKKYFLDIDKTNHYPITFVVKADMSPDEAMASIESTSLLLYPNEVTRAHYLSCFEEIITIPTLVNYLNQEIETNQLESLINELITQSKIEYNI
ncbi:hypothetical protein ACNNM0_09635 [Aerococcus viridans]